MGLNFVQSNLWKDAMDHQDHVRKHITDMGPSKKDIDSQFTSRGQEGQ